MKKFLLLIIFSCNCFAEELALSFDEAKIIAEQTEAIASYKNHQDTVLMPYFSEKYSRVLQDCFKTISHPDDSKFELVIALGATGSVDKVYRDHETNIGLCMIKEFEVDNFPSPLTFPFYVYIAMSFTE